jgi:hypothetical protein
MKTSAYKLSIRGYLTRSDSIKMELNLEKPRVLRPDFKGVHKYGQVSADDLPGVFAARFRVLSIQAINSAQEITAMARQSKQKIESAGTL